MTSQRGRRGRLLTICTLAAAAMGVVLSPDAAAWAAPAAGYAVSHFATGFPTEPCGATPGCGPAGLGLDSQDQLFLIDVASATLHRFGPAGGDAGSHVLASYPFLLESLAMDRSGNLFAVQNGGYPGGPGSGIIQLDASGNLVRDVIALQQCGTSGLGMAVDAKSGDLFVAEYGCADILRITGQAGGTPTALVYAGGFVSDGLTFGPDGTLYAAV